MTPRAMNVHVFVVGVCEAVWEHAGRSRHASDIRRVAQHREGGGARSRGRQAAHSARSQEGQHARLPAAPPAHSCRLPAHWTVRPHRRHDGHLLIRSRRALNKVRLSPAHTYMHTMLCI